MRAVQRRSTVIRSRSHPLRTLGYSGRAAKLARDSLALILVARYHATKGNNEVVLWTRTAVRDRWGRCEHNTARNRPIGAACVGNATFTICDRACPAMVGPRPSLHPRKCQELALSRLPRRRTSDPCRTSNPLPWTTALGAILPSMNRHGGKLDTIRGKGSGGLRRSHWLPSIPSVLTHCSDRAITTRERTRNR